MTVQLDMFATKVVFTGPAEDKNGNRVVRDVLKLAAEARGYEVQACIKPDTQLLVASRGDTKKAAGAAGRGIPVMSYAAFIESLRKAKRFTPYELKGGEPGWVDKYLPSHLKLQFPVEPACDNSLYSA